MLQAGAAAVAASWVAASWAAPSWAAASWAAASWVAASWVAASYPVAGHCTVCPSWVLGIEAAPVDPAFVVVAGRIGTAPSLAASKYRHTIRLLSVLLSLEC